MLFLAALVGRFAPASRLVPALPVREDRPPVAPRGAPHAAPVLVARWAVEDGRPVCHWALRYPRPARQHAARA